MKDIQISATPASLTANFEDVRDSLRDELERYDVVVTEDTLAESKRMATALNKSAEHIDRMRKDKVAEVSAPIREFEAQMKELRDMCKDGRQRINSQVQRFEDRRRQKAAEEAEKYANELRLYHDLPRSAWCAIQGKLSWVTTKGQLSKAGKDAVAAIVQQEISDHREEQLRRERVRSMGVEPDAVDVGADDYREQAERVAQATKPAPVEKGRARVTCVFEFDVGPGATGAKIEAKVRQRLEDAGIQGLTDIKVTC